MRHLLARSQQTTVRNLESAGRASLDERRSVAEKGTLENGFGEGDRKRRSCIQRLANLSRYKYVWTAPVCRDEEIDGNELRSEIHTDFAGGERRCLNGLATGQWRTVIAIVSWYVR